MYSRFLILCLFYVWIGISLLSCDKITYNTFPTTHVRSTMYSPTVIDKTCLLKPDVGPCRAGIPMWYFVPKQMNCSVFTWGGCQGNGNRFETEEECASTCLSIPNHPISRPKWCKLSFDYGFCFGAVNRWYYDHMWKTCKQTIYSGCGGNKNNFYSREMCESICRFGRGALEDPVKTKDGIKKRIIVNPWDVTTKAGRYQGSTKPKHLLN